MAQEVFFGTIHPVACAATDAPSVALIRKSLYPMFLFVVQKHRNHSARDVVSKVHVANTQTAGP